MLTPAGMSGTTSSFRAATKCTQSLLESLQDCRNQSQSLTHCQRQCPETTKVFLCGIKCTREHAQIAKPMQIVGAVILAQQDSSQAESCQYRYVYIP